MTCRRILCSVLVLVVHLASPVIGDAKSPYEIQAAWVDDSSRLQPMGVDFRFHSIAWVPETGFVALADRLVLRITEDRPYVTLGWQRGIDGHQPPRGVIVPAGAHSFWVSGDDRSASGVRGQVEKTRSGYLARYVRGKWESVAGPDLGAVGYGWAFRSLASDGAGRLYGLIDVFSQPPRTDKIEWKSFWPSRTELYVKGGEEWGQVTLPPPADGYSITSLCADAAGDVHLLGVRRPQGADDGWLAGRGSVVSIRYRSGAVPVLTPVPDPSESPYGWYPAGLLCGRGGAMWLTGLVVTDPARAEFPLQGKKPVVFTRQEDTWREVRGLPSRETPATRGSYWVLGGLAVDGQGRLWLSYETEARRTAPLYRTDGRSWEQFELPAVPGVSYYKLSGLAFDDAGIGWAVSNLWGNVADPRSRGILLRYRDGKWVHQNWSWSWLHQRWFGLLGVSR